MGDEKYQYYSPGETLVGVPKCSTVSPRRGGGEDAGFVPMQSLTVTAQQTPRFAAVLVGWWSGGIGSVE